MLEEIKRIVNLYGSWRRAIRVYDSDNAAHYVCVWDLSAQIHVSTWEHHTIINQAEKNAENQEVTFSTGLKESRKSNIYK